MFTNIEDIISEVNKRKDRIITLRAIDDFISERVSDKMEVFDVYDKDGFRNLAFRDGYNLIKIPELLIKSITKKVESLDGNEEISYDIMLPNTKFEICVSWYRLQITYNIKNWIWGILA